MKSYRVSPIDYTGRIEEVETIKKTDKSVIFYQKRFQFDDTQPAKFDKRRESISSQCHIHFESLQKAREYCIDRCERAIVTAENRIIACKKRLEELSSI